MMPGDPIEWRMPMIFPSLEKWTDKEIRASEVIECEAVPIERPESKFRDYERDSFIAMMVNSAQADLYRRMKP